MKNKNRNSLHPGTERQKQIHGKAVLAIVLGAAVLLVSSLNGCGRNQKNTEDVSAAAEQSQAIDNTITWKGKKYTYNTDLTNILFLGIDKSDPIAAEKEPGDGGQSDCIMLLSLNNKTKQATILQINRNTMTDIDVYDFSGNYLKSMTGQLALQYAYNIGGQSSCWATKKTVSELLYGLEIDAYFSMNMGSIAEINDTLGGVDVTMQQDYTNIDPSFKKGTTVHLEGEKAESFVRYRDLDTFNSVSNRMERQTDYVTSLISNMKNKGGKSLYDILSPYLDTDIVTDMDSGQLNALTGYEYLTDQVQSVPGEEVMGDVYEEYRVDGDALQDLILNTYYNEVK